MDTAEEIGFDQEAFELIRTFARKQAGIEISPGKRPMVAGRVNRRLRRLQLTSFSDYKRLLENDKTGKELVELLNVLTTNHTKFFREDHHFDHLVREVLDPIVKKGTPPQRFRIWSAGCSKGHEPYTIALTLAKAIPNIAKWNLKILATDIDTNVLAEGRKGIYQGEEVESIPPQYREQYLTKVDAHGDKWQMNESVRNLIVFNRLNFMEAWPIKGTFDIIFFRNVGIYFSRDTQISLYQRFADKLKSGGWLYIGHSEKLVGVEDQFSSHGKCIYKKT